MNPIDKNELAHWEQYKWFTKTQFDCKHTGKNQMKHFFMLQLEELAAACGFRILVSSGFRDVTHPEEAKKGSTTGAHSEGIAVDLMVSHEQAYIVLDRAMKLGFTGIGLNQRGDIKSRFIHLDLSEAKGGRPRPHVWSY